MKVKGRKVHKITVCTSYDLKLPLELMLELAERDKNATWEGGYDDSLYGRLEAIKGVGSTDYDISECLIFLTVDTADDTQKTWKKIRKVIRDYIKGK